MVMNYKEALEKYKTKYNLNKAIKNKEIQKIKKVDINITINELIVSYETDNDFDINILTNWPKAIIIPYKVSKYLNKNFILLINKEKTDISNFIK